MGDRGGTRRFDRIVMVDWSANSTPKRGRDSIWIATGTSPNLIDEVVNPPTRAAAMAWLVELLISQPDLRVLVGFDFSFGYPAGFATHLLGDGASRWCDVWEWFAGHVTDDDRNRNNRLDVMAGVNEHLRRVADSAPFWGYPGAPRRDALPRTRPPSSAPFPDYRLTEQRMRVAGHRPFSAWQLAYPGSVGSQMILGMRALHVLRHQHELRDRVTVWPFDTGVGPDSCRLPPGGILLAEVWPSLLHVPESLHPIRDAAQVMTLVRDLVHLDTSGGLSTWFAPSLSDDELPRVLREEGWTLGVP